jgi:hypothetical protein
MTEDEFLTQWELEPKRNVEELGGWLPVYAAKHIGSGAYLAWFGLIITFETREIARRTLLDAWKKGKLGAFGFSKEGEGEEERIRRKITQVKDTVVNNGVN